MAERELFEPTTRTKRYVRRDDNGRFEQIDDVGRPSAADQRREAKDPAKRRQGANGDRAS